MNTEDTFYEYMQEIHDERVEAQKQALSKWDGADGKILRAYQDFRLWCRSCGYDPYTDSYERFKAYLSDGDEAYKVESRKLFAPSADITPQMATENKRKLKEVMDKENAAVLARRRTHDG